MKIMQKIAIFVRDLLDYDPALIEIGRTNREREDFKKNHIAIDSISSKTPISRIEKFDGVNEKMIYSQLYTRSQTISFFGDNAYENAQRFELMLLTQKAYELQESLNISIKNIKQTVDLRSLTGVQYSNMLQAEFNVLFSEEIETDTLRIDEANISRFLVD